MTTRIIGTGSYAPENIVTNDDLTKIVDTSDEWIRSRTGIRERRLCIKEGNGDLASQAAARALANAGIKPEEIEIIIVATSSPDYCYPSAACQVQAYIGAENAVAFDISAACSGFIFALNTIQSFIQSGVYKTGLLIGVDVLSKLVDWQDRGTCVLFGDGAGAAVVQARDKGMLTMVMGSEGKKGHVLTCRNRTTGNFLTETAPEMGFTSMDGQEVFKFAVKKVPECIKQVLTAGNVELEEVKYFVLHQANYRIFESISKRLGAPLEKMPMNMERYGNTSAASIPLMLDELNQAGKLERGDKIVLAGFGAGLTWGAALLEW